MQDGAPSGDEAIHWIKRHFDGDPEPEISIQWDSRPISQTAYRGVLDILFGDLMEREINS